MPRKSIFDDIPFPSLSNDKRSDRDSRRNFTERQKKEVRYRQKGRCAKCGKILDPRTTEYHHKKAWSEGGRTTVSNCIAVHADCHRIAEHNRGVKKTRKPKKTHGERIADRLSRL